MNHCLIFLLVTVSIFSQNLTIERIMSKPYLWGSRIHSYQFSQNSKQLYYKNQANNMVISLSDLSHDSLNTPFPESWISNNEFLYREKNQFFLFHTETNTSTIVSGASKYHQYLRKAGTEVSLQDSTVFIKSLKGIGQLNLSAKKDARYSMQTISNNGRYLLISCYENVKDRDLYFPDYLPTFTEPGKQERGVPKSSLYLIDTFEFTSNQIFNQTDRGYLSNLKISDDNTHIGFINHPISRKKIEYFTYNIALKKRSVIYQSNSDKWVTGNYTTLDFSPDSKQLLFIGLKSGNARLFTHDLQTKKNNLITKKDFEVTNAWWQTDDSILFISNEKSPLERHVYSQNLQTNKTTLLSVENGYIRNPVLSPDKSFIAYNFSQLAKPDELYLLNLNQSTHHKLSTTVDPEFNTLSITKPDLIQTKSSDGKFDIYANFYHKGTDKKPLIVFVHGAGILQNVLNGWTPAYHREFLFHQFLIDNGYHVLDVDYRGSEGYSHNFETDVHSHLGKKELEDIVSFIDKLDSESYIDKEKIGIYGGSYGGFMTSYAMAFKPDLFKAGAALRSVFNWENYYYTNEWYTRARLDVFDSHKEWYKRSSPLYHTKNIKNPLLILHGMLDDNVPFQDAVQMIQHLIDDKKTFDLMIYPKEKHSFKLSSSWEDEYKRIFKYFETHIK